VFKIERHVPSSEIKKTIRLNSFDEIVNYIDHKLENDRNRDSYKLGFERWTKDEWRRLLEGTRIYKKDFEKI
jgi:hypothetical protein